MTFAWVLFRTLVYVVLLSVGFGFFVVILILAYEAYCLTRRSLPEERPARPRDFNRDVDDLLDKIEDR